MPTSCANLYSLFCIEHTISVQLAHFHYIVNHHQHLLLNIVMTISSTPCEDIVNPMRGYRQPHVRISLTPCEDIVNPMRGYRQLHAIISLTPCDYIVNPMRRYRQHHEMIPLYIITHLFSVRKKCAEKCKITMKKPFYTCF